MTRKISLCVAAVAAFVLVLSGCTRAVPTPDVGYAMYWWNSLNGDQMVAALYGNTASEGQDAAARKMYADLDQVTKARVDLAATEINGHRSFRTVGEWWESLNCREMNIAAGYGNTHDPMSPYCAHYPNTGAAKILGDDALKHVNHVGGALLGRGTHMVPMVHPAAAERWWNALDGPQMVAALYGDMATMEQAMAAKRMFEDLDAATEVKVLMAADEINGYMSFSSVGEWWESLNCREMNIAAGYGNTHNPMSPYCAHYPGSDFPPEKILGDDALYHVNMVGTALLGRDDPGTYPPADEG